MNIDPDSPDYNDTNQGDHRETEEEKEIERLSAKLAKRNVVCDQILSIMATYHKQEDSDGGIDTPGGLEHMGDVWGLFAKWEALLKA